MTYTQFPWASPSLEVAFGLSGFGTSLSTLLISWIKYLHTMCDIDDQNAKYVYIGHSCYVF